MATFKKIQPYVVVFSTALFFLFEYSNMNSLDPLNTSFMAIGLACYLKETIKRSR